MLPCAFERHRNNRDLVCSDHADGSRACTLQNVATRRNRCTIFGDSMSKKRLRQTGKGVEKQDEMLGGLAVGRAVRGLLSTEQPGRWNCSARGAREDAVRWRAKCARYFAGPRLPRGRGYPEAA